MLNEGYLHFDLNLSGSWTNIIKSNTSISAEEWTHLALSYNGTSARVFINGIMDNEGGLISEIPESGDKYFLGARRSKSGLTNHFIGIIDEVRIYNKALPSDKIINYYYETIE
jgi:hypothetical protein